MSRLYAIPDIHGRKDLLDQLLTVLPLDMTTDKVVFLGDMVDRGFDSKGVLETVKNLQDTYPDSVKVLAGNHEWIMIDALVGNKPHGWDLWMANGGGSTLDSFDQRVPEDWVRWMSKLDLSYEQDGFFFSHAPVPSENDRGLNAGKPYTRDELTWTYDPSEAYLAESMDGTGKTGVCGHIHALHQGILTPRFYDNYIFADAGSGCHSLAPLVAVEVKTKEVHYAWPTDKRELPAREKYY